MSDWEGPDYSALPDNEIYFLNEKEIMLTTELIGEVKPSTQCTRVTFDWRREDPDEHTRCTGTPVSWSSHGMCEGCTHEEQTRCYLYDK